MKYFSRLVLIFILSLAFVSCGKKDTAYNIGDVVMDDGTVLTASQLESYGGSAKPMAVIFSVTGGEHEDSSRVLGVGYKAAKPMVFTQKEDGSCNRNIMANYSIVAAQEYQISAGHYSNQGFFGMLDGRDSWANFGLYDTDAKGGFKKYPAYDYAENYGINNGFAKFEKGWYLPTAAEARMLAKSGIPNLPQIVWTSSQGYDSQDIELVVDLTNGYVEAGFKDMEYSVCSIYCFAE